MRSLKSIEQLEVTENGFGKKVKIANFDCFSKFFFQGGESKFKKTKKLSPGKGLKNTYAKFEDDRAIRSDRKRLWKMRYQKVKPTPPPTPERRNFWPFYDFHNF